MGNSRAADQSEVWDQIAKKSERMAVPSATSALSDVYDSHGSSVDDYVRRLHIEPGQTGAVFAIDGKVEGLELFDSAETFSKMFDKLVRSYALDALDALEIADGPSAVPSIAEAQGFVHDLAGARVQHYAAIGLGEELRIDSDSLVAGGLCIDEKLVHLVAFRK